MARGTILIIDDEVDIATILERRLSGEGFRVLVINDTVEVIPKVKVFVPDLILLDISLPGMDGIEVKKRLNADRETADIPVIFLTAKADIESKVKGFQLNAEDYVTKPYDFQELLVRIEAAMNRAIIAKMAITDALTGLQNAHSFRSNLELFFNIARRYGRIFSIAVIDVDEFKAVNDKYGHPGGDEVLRAIAGVLQTVFRRSDVLIRYGGDEFVVLMPESNEAQASAALNRLRDQIGKKRIPVGANEEITVGLSMGMASYRKDLKSPDDMFEIADKKMYEEKTGKK